MAKKKAANTATIDPKVKRVPSDTVAKTNKMFVVLKTVGQVDGKGKTIFSIGYGGKVMAEANRPWSTLIYPLVMEIARFAEYSNDDAAIKDLKEFQDKINDLQYGGST